MHLQCVKRVAQTLHIFSDSRGLELGYLSDCTENMIEDLFEYLLTSSIDLGVLSCWLIRRTPTIVTVFVLESLKMLKRVS